MQTNITSERTYTVSYYKPGSKTQYGVSVSVVGDKKAKVLRDAKEMLLQAQKDALEAQGLLPTMKVDRNED